MPAPTTTEVAAVRRFNRTYTARANLLAEAHLDSAFSLAEVRLLFELAHRHRAAATDLCRDLRLDKGYVSRVLRRFRHRGLVRSAPSPADRRVAVLSLTRAGRAAFARLNAAASARVRAMLAPLSPVTRGKVLDAMAAIGAALGERATTRAGARPAASVTVLRRPRPGDLGWVVQRHGALYAREYGYDERFEALVAKIVAEFVGTLDPKRERCWIAEQDGRPVGSVFLVRQKGRVARLRLLFVDPSARGAGVGRRLVHACTAFARAAGYTAIELWTQEELTAARTLYQREGYRLVSKQRHAMFGRPAVAETWRLELQDR